MPGPRQKLSVLEGNGRKHLSKKEKNQRQAQEVNLPKPKTLRVPKWLPECCRKDFRALAKELLAADMGLAQLDADTLGRYVAAQANYTKTLAIVHAALADQDGDALKEATKVLDTYFKEARACANDLGMTITSRCRLVLPEGAKPKEENPFEAMMKARAQRA